MTISLSKIQDVCYYLGLAEDVEGLNGIAEVRLVPHKVIVLRYAQDEDGNKRLNLNGTVMLTDQVIEVVEEDEDEDTSDEPTETVIGYEIGDLGE